MTEIQKERGRTDLLVIGSLGDWNLFGTWDLVIGILF